MGVHLIVGSGAVGTATAQALAHEGHEVIVATRSGSGQGGPSIRHIALDATDSHALLTAARGADALYNCANPRYHRWAQDWPPLASALLEAAAGSGATLVTMSNLYGYGPVDHPMTPSDPLTATYTNGQIRAAMWREAKSAHDAGRASIVEVRASDFFGPNTGRTSMLGRALPNLLRGRTVTVLGDPSQPHTWSFIPDVGRTLAAVATMPSTWGQAWHVPSPPAMSQRELLERAATIAGVEAPRIRKAPKVAVRALGLFDPEMRPLRDVSYQFEQPFLMDSSATSAALGIEATDLDEAIRRTIDAEQGTRTSA